MHKLLISSEPALIEMNWVIKIQCNFLRHCERKYIGCLYFTRCWSQSINRKYSFNLLRLVTFAFLLLFLIFVLSVYMTLYSLHQCFILAPRIILEKYIAYLRLFLWSNLRWSPSNKKITVYLHHICGSVIELEHMQTELLSVVFYKVIR